MRWSNVRLEADTMTLLQRYRVRLENAIQRQPERYPLHLRDKRISLSEAVNWLLHKACMQQERERRYTKRKASRDLPGQQLIPFPEQGTMDVCAQPGAQP